MRFMQRMSSLTAVGLFIATLSGAHGTRKSREIKVSVTEKGFVPSNIKSSPEDRIRLFSSTAFSR